MTVATVPRGLPGDPASPDALAAKAAAVRVTLAGLRGAVVAFSGGVDSSIVAAFALEMLGEQALACTIVSGLLPDDEIREAEAIAALLHDTIEDQGREGATRTGIREKFGEDVLRIV